MHICMYINMCVYIYVEVRKVFLLINVSFSSFGHVVTHVLPHASSDSSAYSPLMAVHICLLHTLLIYSLLSPLMS